MNHRRSDMLSLVISLFWGSILIFNSWILSNHTKAIEMLACEVEIMGWDTYHFDKPQNERELRCQKLIQQHGQQ